jgi:hypothetical protein
MNTLPPWMQWILHLCTLTGLTVWVLLLGEIVSNFLWGTR